MLFHILGSETFIADSIHMLSKDHAILPPALWELQRCATRIYFETDIERSPGIPACALLEVGMPLSSVVSEKTFAAATSLWESFGIQLRIETTKPWFAGLMLAVHLGQGLGYDRAFGVDCQLWKATPPERRFVLEGTEALSAFDASPFHEQLAYLEMVALTPSVITDRLQRLHKYWASNDAGGFEKELILAKQQFPVMTTGLVDNRNQAWLPAIIDLARLQMPSLVLVGALHLVGPASIPMLLSQLGFEVNAL